MTRKSECYYRWSSYGESDAEIGMDYFFWVLRNGAATIVVDTGFHPESGARRGRTCLCPPVEALRRIGVDPGTVGTVVLTHLHYDHTGNVAAFPQAELVVQRSELDFWSGSEAGEAQVAPRVAAICVGGHSPGQTVLTVAAGSGPVVLASDAVHYYEELELRRPFEILVD